MKEPEDLGWRPYVKTWIQRLQGLTKVKGKKKKKKKKPAQRNFKLATEILKLEFINKLNDKLFVA